jgi:hypothetical protein
MRLDLEKNQSKNTLKFSFKRINKQISKISPPLYM